MLHRDLKKKKKKIHGWFSRHRASFCFSFLRNDSLRNADSSLLPVIGCLKYADCLIKRIGGCMAGPYQWLGNWLIWLRLTRVYLQRCCSKRPHGIPTPWELQWHCSIWSRQRQPCWSRSWRRSRHPNCSTPIHLPNVPKKIYAFCLVPFKSHPLVAPFRFLPPKPLSPHLANRCGGKGGPTARPAGGASQGSRDGRCHARTASPDAAFSHCLQDNAVRCWAAGEEGAVDYACSWYCGGGACASCDGG